MTARKVVLSCNFEQDFCGWTLGLASIATMQWVRTNQATPEGNTGPMWGYPKGSYYAYTNSTNVRQGRKGQEIIFLVFFFFNFLNCIYLTFCHVACN